MDLELLITLKWTWLHFLFELHILNKGNWSHFSSVTQSCLTLCNPMDWSMPDFPVHHQLLGACSNSCPLTQWCHPTISSSVIPFSSCLQSFPASGSFPVSQLFASGGQNIGASVSAPVLLMNIQDWFPLGLTSFIPLQSKSLLQHHSSKASILWHSAFFIVQLSHPYTTTGKPIALTRWTFVDTVISLLFNMLSRMVKAFLPRSKCPLISWLQSTSAVILEPKKIGCHCFHCFLIYLPWSDGTGCGDHVFWMPSFKATFPLSLFTFKRLFSSSLLSSIRVVSSVYLKLLIFLLKILIPACASFTHPGISHDVLCI